MCVGELDVKADVAIWRLERLEKENLQLEDEALEAGLPEALADKTKVVKTSGSSTRASALAKFPQAKSSSSTPALSEVPRFS